MDEARTTTDDHLLHFRQATIEHFHNVAALSGAAYPSEFRTLLDLVSAAQVRAHMMHWAGYEQTPLRSLDDVAAEAGINRLYYKDESERFGLKSFKALGGAYAVDQLLIRELGRRLPAVQVTPDDLSAGAYRRECREITIATATDGNHGRSVAWGARRRGCPCRIYIHAGVSPGREQALADLGAKVVRVDGNYDDSVRQAARDAMDNGWFVVSDTSSEGYLEPPRDVMRGYMVMMAEIADQLGQQPPPSHVFVQGGVGGLAAAVIGFLWDRYQESRPRIVIVEPQTAACLHRSAIAGVPVAIEGDLDTMMAGLSCGEVSTLAWPLVHKGADAFLTIADETVPHAMRLLAGIGIEAGESAVAGLSALLIVMGRPALADTLELGGDSRVLLFGTEGATDPEIYSRIVNEGVLT